MAARLENALINGGGNLKGIGSTLEGLDVMQFPYEYILEKAWNLNVDDNKWLNVWLTGCGMRVAACARCLETIIQ